MSATLPSPLPTKLNLGCGQFPLSGFLNVDVEKHAKADVYLDLDDLRNYELFPSCHFEIIVMDHVLEHLDDVFGVLIAVHRLLKPGGRLEIRVPHFSRGITHPEHRHGFDVTFPEYMRPAFSGGYIGVALELESMRLDYMIRWDLKEVAVRPWQVPILKMVNRVVSGLANLQPYACSRFWCTWVGGFEQIEFVFRKAA
ncbi:MAG TPA: methyltransferase domain-containing protein [Myxococcales bacterium]|nr:methyltransferase domain-containing protein [Myxococcales bacterium]